MDDLTKSAFLNRPDLHVETSGEFKGWRTWSRDSFETHNGPFWHRMAGSGAPDAGSEKSCPVNAIAVGQAPIP